MAKNSVDLKEVVGDFGNNKLYSNLTVKEKVRLIKIQDKLEKGKKLSWIDKRAVNKLAEKDEYKSFNETKDIRKYTEQRKDLTKKFNYERRKAQHHWQQMQDLMKSLYLGQNTRNSYVIEKPKFLDFTSKNHLYNLDNSDIQKLIDEMRQWVSNVNSKSKKMGELMEKQVERLEESLEKGYITQEEFEKEMKSIQVNMKTLGFNTSQVDKMISNIGEQFNLDNNLWKE